ncbi:MAG: hypothetical protein A4E69_02549 [Syntrophus sp. PtaB.Bin138]|nr:MAG: hypothetical protein A4E69_02549 [Syntrophus sp. PtaB.Bin138]
MILAEIVFVQKTCSIFFPLIPIPALDVNDRCHVTKT